MKSKNAARRRRHERARKKVHGTAVRPRLAVFRSNTGIYAQVIDDSRGHTLAAASSREAVVVKGEDGKTGQATQVGTLVAERAAAAGVTTVVFDRGGNRYAGRVAALADAARKSGLDF
jgi:large subunit ribosomal protein L18